MKQFAVQRFFFADDVGQRGSSDLSALHPNQNSLLTFEQVIDYGRAETRRENAIESRGCATALHMTELGHT